MIVVFVCQNYTCETHVLPDMSHLFTLQKIVNNKKVVELFTIYGSKLD